MIASNPKSLPDNQRKLIQEWLRAPGARAFQEFVANLAAQQTAEAGNKLVENTHVTNIEAADCATKARCYLTVNKIMDDLSNPEYKFEPADLKPAIKPLN